MNLIHFMHYLLIAEHPNQWPIVENIFYISIGYLKILFWRQKSGSKTDQSILNRLEHLTLGLAFDILY